MRLGVLAWDPSEQESVGITKLGSDRGHDTVMFEFDDIGCRETAQGLEPTITGRPAAEFDAIVSRGNVGAHNWRDASERLYVLSSVPGLLMLDPAEVHLPCVAKFSMLAALTRAGVPVPPTRAIRSVGDVAAAYRDWGPLVLKPSVGFGGFDVHRLPTGLSTATEPVVRDLLDRFGVLIGQPYLPHEGDYRVTLIGEKTTISVRAATDTGENWRPNHGYGNGPTPVRSPIERIDPPADLVELAQRARRALGLSISGVDLVYVDGRPLVIEANYSAGWDGFPSRWQDIVNADVLDFVEARVSARANNGGRRPSDDG